MVVSEDTYFNWGVARIITRHKLRVLFVFSSWLVILIKVSLANGHFALSQTGLILRLSGILVGGFSLSSKTFAWVTSPFKSLNTAWQFSSGWASSFKFAENPLLAPGMICCPSWSCRYVLQLLSSCPKLQGVLALTTFHREPVYLARSSLSLLKRPWLRCKAGISPLIFGVQIQWDRRLLRLQ